MTTRARNAQSRGPAAALVFDERADIEARLAALGVGIDAEMGASIDGEGHPLTDLATGEPVVAPTGEVLALAEAWSRITNGHREDSDWNDPAAGAGQPRAASAMYESLWVNGQEKMRGNGTLAVVYNNLVGANALPDWPDYLRFMARELAVEPLDGTALEYRVLDEAIAVGRVGEAGRRVDGLAALEVLWRALGDVPVNDDDEIETPFLDFEVGTHRESVWHWFERQDKRFSVAEHMGRGAVAVPH